MDGMKLLHLTKAKASKSGDTMVLVEENHEYLSQELFKSDAEALVELMDELPSGTIDELVQLLKNKAYWKSRLK